MVYLAIVLTGCIALLYTF